MSSGCLPGEDENRSIKIERDHRPVEVYSTSPASDRVPKAQYLSRVIDAAHWCEEYGIKGTLVYTDNSLVDPWFVAEVIIQNTKSLEPLVAVQPVYMHPYSVAKKVTSLAFFYDRRVVLNMVAGGFKNDLTALNDLTPHDRRYDRLFEYTSIIQKLLGSTSAFSFNGEFYKVDKLRLAPPLPQTLMPSIFISGSSDSGMATARKIGAVAVEYPKPVGEYVGATNASEGLTRGIRIGIITREDEEEAWRVAGERFPEDRKGRIAHELAMRVSDSVWHKRLSEMAEEIKGKRSPYWLGPLQIHKTFCPYLVGSHERVSEELSRYIQAGFKIFILDIPPSEEECRHTQRVFEQASRV